MIWSYWLIVYDGSGVDGDNDGVRGGGIGSSEQYGKRMDSVLDSLSDLYSELDAISVGVSGPSSCSISHHLLTTYFINYCPKKRVNDFSLRRLFYTKQDLKNICCSSA